MRRWVTTSHRTRNGLSSKRGAKYLKPVASEFTAQAFITTDLDDNQITAFHPGAMMHAHLQTVPTDGSISLG